MKQDTRVDFNIYVLDPATDLNPKQFYTYVKCKNGSRLPMYSMQIMTQTYQIGYHLHIMPCSTLPGILNGVNTHNATGPDEVLARLLKEAADQFSPIFWVFYRQSIVLVEWRTANVIPIFKKVNHASSANYRPVSMTSVCFKVMKHNISSQIMRQASTRSCPKQPARFNGRHLIRFCWGIW